LKTAIAPIDGVADVLNHLVLALDNHLFALPVIPLKRTPGEISGKANFAL
jgi:hypothetical protein